MFPALLQTDTTRIIFSFTDEDPDDETGLSYHGSSNRGTKSVVLLSYHDEHQNLPDDVISMDILVSEVSCAKKIIVVVATLTKGVVEFENLLLGYRWSFLAREQRTGVR